MVWDFRLQGLLHFRAGVWGFRVVGFRDLEYKALGVVASGIIGTLMG